MADNEINPVTQRTEQNDDEVEELSPSKQAQGSKIAKDDKAGDGLPS